MDALDLVLVLCEKTTQQRDVHRSIIDARDDRHARRHIGQFQQCLKVSVDLLIRLPAVPDMLLFIDDFDIKKHVIYKIDDFEYRGQTEVPAGFHSCSIPFSLAHFTHFLNEFRMQKRLSARKGYTTTRLLVKNLILIDDLKDFFRSLQLTDDLPRILATRTDTRPAVLTLAWDLLHPASVMMKLDCFVDAVGDTPPAAGAFIAIIHQLRIRIDGFRIGTPFTFHGTSLEKYICPDPRSVVGAKFLYVCNVN